MSASVHVKNISSQTGEKEVRDFFSFCGKISSLDLSQGANSTQSAKVTFEKETAAKTALLLDNTQLGPNQVEVTSETSSSSTSATGNVSGSAGQDGQDIEQEDKPRSRILAEYLAQGYVVSDNAIEKAIAFDREHGISGRFTDALGKATQRAQAVDDRLKVSEKVSGMGSAAWHGLNSYFEQALGTPTGQKLRAFYEQGNKQVMDVHNEARHLADMRTGKAQDMHNLPGSERTKCSCSANAGKCPCAPGKCACNDCGKNPDASTSKTTSEGARTEKIPGTT